MLVVAGLLVSANTAEARSKSYSKLKGSDTILKCIAINSRKLYEGK